MADKKYWHQLSQEEIADILSSGKTWGQISEEYLQPDWCGEYQPLMGEFGCWSLLDLSEGGSRTMISPDFCKNCDSCKKNL
jgi:hypothetical protein